jgi:hypothetical protein
MAEPERRDINQPPTHVDDLGDQRVVERETRGGWRWWWVVPVIIALAVWWAGWGWGGTGGWWWGRVQSENTRIPAKAGATTAETLANAGAQQPSTSASADKGGPETSMTGPGVPILAAADKQAFIGKSFSADRVPVNEKVSDHAMWIGGAHPMLAVVAGNGNEKAVDTGKIVVAAGTVKKAPPARQARREWSLSNQDATRLEQEGAYIQISELNVPQR